MGIAVDQTRLRRIVQKVMPEGSLGHAEARTILQIGQLAAGADLHDDPAELAVLQAVAQYIGLKPGEILPIPPAPDDASRATWLGSLAGQLGSRGARELAYVVAFLVSVSDLELTPAETAALEQFQFALGLDHRRATDLVIVLSEIVASDAA